MSDTIKIGDVVVHKSGGGRMVVTAETAYDSARVECQWKDAKGKSLVQTFPVVALQKVVRPEDIDLSRYI